MRLRRPASGLVATLLLAGAAGPLAHAPAAADAPAHPVDTVRAAAYDAYHQVLAPALAVPIGWTGSVATCDAGAQSAAALDATLTAVNYFRDMEGLQRVTFDPALTQQAQQAALIMQAQGDLSHNPPSTWACWTQTGHDAAGASNLALGTAGANAVVGYMTDPGTNNTVAGHRRWIIYPPQRAMGSGSTSGANALYVFGTQDTSDAGPGYLPYPAAGAFPAQLEPQGRWSLSAPDRSTDFSGATVTVTTQGRSLPVQVQPVANGYGNNTLVWQLDPGYPKGVADQSYDVTVANIVVNGSPTSYSYTTRLFDATVDHRQTISFPAPAQLVQGESEPVAATASSGLPVTLSTATPSVCTVSGGRVTALAAGSCTVAADQVGDANFSTAPTVSQSFTVVADTFAPTATVGGASFAASLASSRALTWSGTDRGTGVHDYDLRQRTSTSTAGFSAWQYPAAYQHITAVSGVVPVPAGATVCVQVRSRDGVGNVSPWTADRCTARPLDNPALGHSVGWTSRSGATGYYGRTVLSTKRAGASVSHAAKQVDRVALVATTCSSCGKVAVFVGATRVGVLSLVTSSTHRQRVLLLPRFGARTGTVSVRVTTKNRLVEVDGLLLTRM